MESSAPADLPSVDELKNEMNRPSILLTELEEKNVQLHCGDFRAETSQLYNIGNGQFRYEIKYVDKEDPLMIFVLVVRSFMKQMDATGTMKQFYKMFISPILSYDSQAGLALRMNIQNTHGIVVPVWSSSYEALTSEIDVPDNPMIDDILGFVYSELREMQAQAQYFRDLNVSAQGYDNTVMQLYRINRILSDLEAGLGDKKEDDEQYQSMLQWKTNIETKKMNSLTKYHDQYGQAIHIHEITKLSAIFWGSVDPRVADDLCNRRHVILEVGDKGTREFFQPNLMKFHPGWWLGMPGPDEVEHVIEYTRSVRPGMIDEKDWRIGILNSIPFVRDRYYHAQYEHAKQNGIASGNYYQKTIPVSNIPFLRYEAGQLWAPLKVPGRGFNPNSVSPLVDILPYMAGRGVTAIILFLPIDASDSVYSVSAQAIAHIIFMSNPQLNTVVIWSKADNDNETTNSAFDPFHHVDYSTIFHQFVYDTDPDKILHNSTLLIFQRADEVFEETKNDPPSASIRSVMELGDEVMFSNADQLQRENEEVKVKEQIKQIKDESKKKGKTIKQAEIDELNARLLELRDEELKENKRIMEESKSWGEMGEAEDEIERIEEEERSGQGELIRASVRDAILGNVEPVFDVSAKGFVQRSMQRIVDKYKDAKQPPSHEVLIGELVEVMDKPLSGEFLQIALGEIAAQTKRFLRRWSAPVIRTAKQEINSQLEEGFTDLKSHRDVVLVNSWKDSRAEPVPLDVSVERTRYILMDGEFGENIVVDLDDPHQREAFDSHMDRLSVIRFRTPGSDPMTVSDLRLKEFPPPTVNQANKLWDLTFIEWKTDGRGANSIPRTVAAETINKAWMSNERWVLWAEYEMLYATMISKDIQDIMEHQRLRTIDSKWSQTRITSVAKAALNIRNLITQEFHWTTHRHQYVDVVTIPDRKGDDPVFRDSIQFPGKSRGRTLKYNMYYSAIYDIDDTDKKDVITHTPVISIVDPEDRDQDEDQDEDKKQSGTEQMYRPMDATRDQYTIKRREVAEVINARVDTQHKIIDRMRAYHDASLDMFGLLHHSRNGGLNARDKTNIESQISSYYVHRLLSLAEEADFPFTEIKIEDSNEYHTFAIVRRAASYFNEVLYEGRAKTEVEDMMTLSIEELMEVIEDRASVWNTDASHQKIDDIKHTLVGDSVNDWMDIVRTIGADGRMNPINEAVIYSTTSPLLRLGMSRHHYEQHYDMIEQYRVPEERGRELLSVLHNLVFLMGTVPTLFANAKHYRGPWIRSFINRSKRFNNYVLRKNKKAISGALGSTAYLRYLKEGTSSQGRPIGRERWPSVYMKKVRDESARSGREWDTVWSKRHISEYNKEMTRAKRDIYNKLKREGREVDIDDVDIQSMIDVTSTIGDDYMPAMPYIEEWRRNGLINSRIRQEQAPPGEERIGARQYESRKRELVIRKTVQGRPVGNWKDNMIVMNTSVNEAHADLNYLTLSRNVPLSALVQQDMYAIIMFATKLHNQIQIREIKRGARFFPDEKARNSRYRLSESVAEMYGPISMTSMVLEIKDAIYDYMRDDPEIRSGMTYSSREHVWSTASELAEILYNNETASGYPHIPMEERYVHPFWMRNGYEEVEYTFKTMPPPKRESKEWRPRKIRTSRAKTPTRPGDTTTRVILIDWALCLVERYISIDKQINDQFKASAVEGKDEKNYLHIDLFAARERSIVGILSLRQLLFDIHKRYPQIKEFPDSPHLYSWKIAAQVVRVQVQNYLTQVFSPEKKKKEKEQLDSRLGRISPFTGIDANFILYDTDDQYSFTGVDESKLPSKLAHSAQTRRVVQQKFRELRRGNARTEYNMFRRSLETIIGDEQTRYTQANVRLGLLDPAMFLDEKKKKQNRRKKKKREEKKKGGAPSEEKKGDEELESEARYNEWMAKERLLEQEEKRKREYQLQVEQDEKAKKDLAAKNKKSLETAKSNWTRARIVADPLDLRTQVDLTEDEKKAIETQKSQAFNSQWGKKRLGDDQQYSAAITRAQSSLALGIVMSKDLTLDQRIEKEIHSNYNAFKNKVYRKKKTFEEESSSEWERNMKQSKKTKPRFEREYKKKKGRKPDPTLGGRYGNLSSITSVYQFWYRKYVFARIEIREMMDSRAGIERLLNKYGRLKKQYNKLQDERSDLHNLNDYMEQLKRSERSDDDHKKELRSVQERVSSISHRIKLSNDKYNEELDAIVGFYIGYPDDMARFISSRLSDIGISLEEDTKTFEPLDNITMLIDPMTAGKVRFDDTGFRRRITQQTKEAKESEEKKQKGEEDEEKQSRGTQWTDEFGNIISEAQSQFSAMVRAGTEEDEELAKEQTKLAKEKKEMERKAKEESDKKLFNRQKKLMSHYIDSTVTFIDKEIETLLDGKQATELKKDKLTKYTSLLGTLTTAKGVKEKMNDIKTRSPGSALTEISALRFSDETVAIKQWHKKNIEPTTRPRLGPSRRTNIRPGSSR